MKISEIMSPTVYTIGPEATLKECSDIIDKHKVNGLVVIEGHRAVGVITKADIFRAILPSYSDIIEDEQYMSDPEYIEDRVYKYIEIKVREIMGTPVMAATGDMSVTKAGSTMILRKIKQLPVVDNERLVGIVTMTDILGGLLKKDK
jgi:CBS domain-containing protein